MIVQGVGLCLHWLTQASHIVPMHWQEGSWGTEPGIRHEHHQMWSQNKKEERNNSVLIILNLVFYSSEIAITIKLF